MSKLVLPPKTIGEIDPHTFEPLPEMWTGRTKGDINAIASMIVGIVVEHGHALNMAERLSAMEVFIKAVKEDSRWTEAVTGELSRYSGKLTTASGAKIEATENGVTYDYSNDSGWQQLKAEWDEINKLLKEREEQLRKYPPGKEIVDPETGEVLAVGPSKSSKSSYKITLSK